MITFRLSERSSIPKRILKIHSLSNISHQDLINSSKTNHQIKLEPNLLTIMKIIPTPLRQGKNKREKMHTKRKAEGDTMKHR